MTREPFQKPHHFNEKILILIFLFCFLVSWTIYFFILDHVLSGDDKKTCVQIENLKNFPFFLWQNQRADLVIWSIINCGAQLLYISKSLSQPVSSASTLTISSYILCFYFKTFFFDTSYILEMLHYNFPWNKQHII